MHSKGTYAGDAGQKDSQRQSYGVSQPYWEEKYRAANYSLNQIEE